MPTPLDYQLAHRFEELGRQLREAAATSPTAGWWEAPLAFWAIPRDRRLPRALLGRATRDIVLTPFAKLYATPGIGTKKLVTLIQLLERAVAASRETSGVPALQGDAAADAGSARRAVPDVGPPAESWPLNDPGVDAASVSETQWAQWCAAVKGHHLTREPLGRFVLTLRDLPSVMWQTPLSDYVDLTLDELRRRKTHGEKRVRCVLEVFSVAHALLGDKPSTHLRVRVVPAFAGPVEDWLMECARGLFPSADEVRRGFVEPLLAQLRHDAGEAVAELASGRLRERPKEFNVRAAAKQLGLTRARVYQLLSQAAAVMEVRWREGGQLMQALREQSLRSPSPSRGAGLFLSAADLFYPRRTPSSSSPNRSTPAPRNDGPPREDEDPSAAAA